MSTTQQPEIKVGIVGLGQGRSHLAAFQALEGSRVLAVADLYPEVRQAIASTYAIDRQYESLEALLDDRTSTATGSVLCGSS